MLREWLPSFAQEVREDPEEEWPQEALTRLIDEYFEERGMTHADLKDAAGFLISEAAEVWDAVMHEQGGYLRSNDDPDTVEGELADCYMMLLEAADRAEVNLQAALFERMMDKLEG